MNDPSVGGILRRMRGRKGVSDDLLLHQRPPRDPRPINSPIHCNPPFPPSTESKEKMKEAECVNCKRKQSSCLPGKPLTETLIQDPVELRVKSNGNKWKENEMGIIGTIVKKKKTSGNCFLKVLWDINTGIPYHVQNSTHYV